MTRYKLLFFSHTADFVGGGELSLYELVKACRSYGYSCHVVVPDEGDFSSALRQIDCSYSVASTKYMWSIDLGLIDAEVADISSDMMMSFAEIIEDERPDVVITNTVVMPWASDVAHALGIPTILLISELAFADYFPVLHPDPSSYINRLFQANDRLVFNSEFTRNYYGHCCEAGKSSVLFPVLGMEDLRETQIEPAVFNDEISIIVVGSIERNKNQKTVLRAAARAIEEGVNIAKILLIGHTINAEYKEELLSFIDENDMESIARIQDFSTEIYRVILEYNTLIVPSKYESFGRTALEGQLLGRFVIVSDGIATADLVKDGVTGLIYERGNTEDLSEKIKYIYYNQGDAASIAKQARQMQTSNFLSPYMLKPFIVAVEDAISERKPASYLSVYDPIIAMIEKLKQLRAENNDPNKTMRELIDQKNAELAQKEQIIMRQAWDIEGLSHTLQEKSRIIKRKNSRIKQIEKKLKTTTKKYREITRSRWWRLTKPLRRVSSALRDKKKNEAAAVETEPIETNQEKAVDLTLAEQRKHKFPRDVKISIVTPLYNTDVRMLRQLIESVRAQTYQNWELCLADGSDDRHDFIVELVETIAASDDRIIYRKLDENLGIAGNSNVALDMSTGEYIALLDHDDMLDQSALFYVMRAICDDGADFVYTDEAKFVDSPSRTFDRFYKPDFAIDALRGNNYICHCTVFSRELLEKIGGGFRLGFDGAQDHDLILRLTEQAGRIVHVPRILYYWRASMQSTAAGIGNKPYALESGVKAVAEHLSRIGLRGTVELAREGVAIYRTRYDIEGVPKISIIIPNKDNAAVLKRLIASITEKTTYSNYEIIVAENNSSDIAVFEYYNKIKQMPTVSVIEYKGDFNYSAINNHAVRESHGEYILLLNNDLEIISDDWLEEMLMFAQRPDVGAVGPMLYYHNDTIQSAGTIFGLSGIAGHAFVQKPRGADGYFGNLLYARNVSAVTAACLMMRRRVFDEVGGFDEDHLAIAFNDVDLCMKIRKAGYLNIWTPFAELYHYESLSRGYEDTPEKQRRFQKEIAVMKERWARELEEGDPYYNPNLSLTLGSYVEKS